MLKLFVVQNTLGISSEKRFPSDITIEKLKSKIYPVVGIEPQNQQLQLLDQDNNLIANLSNDNAPLNSFPVRDYMCINVIDSNPISEANLASLNDLSSVPKYEISDEDYKKRPDSFLKFKEKFIDPKQKEKKDLTEAKEKELSTNIQVGQRCKTNLSRGKVLYVGPYPKDSDTIWIGIHLDEPLGKHNGTVNNIQYFQCPDKYGIFLKPSMVMVGDFPEIDPFDVNEEI